MEDLQSLLTFSDIKNNDLTFPFQNFHFPLFILLVKALNFITNNYYLGFSILGGISVFGIIYFTLKLLKTPLPSLEGGLVAFLFFFNPVIWITSNRLTPELTGSCLVIISFYYLINDHEKSYIHLIGSFLLGLLGGICYFMIPFLIPSFFYSLFKKKAPVLAILALISGMSVWLIPCFFFNGIDIMSNTLKNSIFVQFNFSGISNLITFCKDFWTGALGGFWIGRTWLTIFISMGVLPLLFFGTMILLSFNYSRKKCYVYY